MVKVYATKDEFWPWFDLYDFAERYHAASAEIPDQLWADYRDASKRYWDLKLGILVACGLAPYGESE